MHDVLKCGELIIMTSLIQHNLIKNNSRYGTGTGTYPYSGPCDVRVSVHAKRALLVRASEHVHKIEIRYRTVRTARIRYE